MKAFRIELVLVAALIGLPASFAFAKSGRAVTARVAITPAFDPANFTAPVANPFFPLVVGTIYVYEAETEDGIERTTTTVTGNTPVINGVTAVEVHDVEELELENGDVILIEDTLDWFASDNFGNVWYLGESTLEYEYDEDWNFLGTSSEGSWTAGVNDAEAGIIMLADPKPGAAYRQEFAEGIAEDMGKVERLNGKVSVPYGEFSDVLVTKEWSPLEPGSVERKYYVAGIGLVLVEEFKGKGTLRQELIDVILP